MKIVWRNTEMNLNKAWMALLTALMLALTTGVIAQDNDIGQSKQEAELEAAYEAALEAAEKQQKAALAAVERAQKELEAVAEERARMEMERARGARANSEVRAAREAEMAERSRELSQVHEELRRASREVARVHREITRPPIAIAPKYSVKLGDRAVIGVILGGSNDSGVKVLGVSPDGPAERAGVLQGDVIVSMMGEKLAVEDGNARDVLYEVMEDVEIGDELFITVDRDGDLHEYTVVAEKREPFAWQSVVRLSSEPRVPGASVLMERIVVPAIDLKHLEHEIERIKEDLEHHRVIIESGNVVRFSDNENGEFEFEFERFSDFGDAVLAETNVWFGLPMTRGLKFAEIDEGLGEYFKTDRGVLVLKARDDNDLQLQSGDVILQVGGLEVNKPADIMRALRDIDSGSQIEIDIKRNRKDKTLEVVVPQQRMSYEFAPHDDSDYHFEFRTEKD